jgi:hypothetical protein
LGTAEHRGPRHKEEIHMANTQEKPLSKVLDAHFFLLKGKFEPSPIVEYASSKRKMKRILKFEFKEF